MKPKHSSQSSVKHSTSEKLVKKGPREKTLLMRSVSGEARLRMRFAARSAAMLKRLKFKEETLREEIRASRTLMQGTMQWGVTTLAAIETALYYVRRDVANNLSLHHLLPPNGTVPPVRWFVGTGFLLLIATVFCVITKYMTGRHVGYRRQLLEMGESYSGIEERPTGGRINCLPQLLFLAFPAFDCLVWLYFHITSSITIMF